MTKKRTLGWVQDAGDIFKLKNILKVMDSQSSENEQMRTVLLPKYVSNEELRNVLIEALKHDEIPYILLKGRGASEQLTVYDNINMFGYLQSEAERLVRIGGRSNAACSGIAQLCLKSQTRIPNGGYKPYQSDWATESFLRLGIALGFINYNSDTDMCKLSETGKDYLRVTNDSVAEKEKLIFAMLSYPPACRVLELLVNSGSTPLTKFEIGSKLGFVGEAGFTSIPQDIFVSGYVTASLTEKAEIIRNVEGSSDKYARMIGKWLVDLGLAEKVEKHVYANYGNRIFDMIIKDSFIITLEGCRYSKYIRGTSRLARTPKIVYKEMLATKAQGAEYLRNRRTLLLRALHTDKTIEQLGNMLEEYGIVEDIITIRDDILNFRNIGLEISENRGVYKLRDNIINLKDVDRNTTEDKPQVLLDKDYVRSKLFYVEHKYLELIDLAFNGKSNFEFELLTTALLCETGLYKGKHLGGARKPDGAVYFEDNGIIFDTKAYSEGYNLSVNQADEMIRYIEENKQRGTINPNCWWRVFPNEVNNFSYLFVSSFFIGQFANNIEYIKNRTRYDGAVISAKNLLLFVETVMSGKIMKNESMQYLRKNKEIVEEDFDIGQDALYLAAERNE